MANDAAELIEIVCDAPAVVIGHSMGALIMLQLALDRPDLVTLGVSLAGAARGDVGWAGDYMRAEIALRRQGIRLPVDFMAVHNAALMYPGHALQGQAFWQELRGQLMSPAVHENNEDTVLSQWQACLDFNVESRLASLRTPLEVVAFAEDVCAPPAYSAELARLAPVARYHELPGLGHASLFAHRPEVVAGFLRELLDDHFRRRR
jgi:pimeloyl-ACP methyl ester carboxylesterase